MILKKNIFDLFEDKETELVTAPKESFINSSFARVGMFNKIIQNHKVFFQKLILHYQKNNKQYDLDVISNYSKLITFSRAFSYINKIDVSNKTDIDALKCYDSFELIFNLDQSIMFFEEKEEYEKCSKLLGIKKIIEEF